MNGSEKKKIIKSPHRFEKGNKFAVGHKYPKEKSYVARCKEFMEEEGGGGWDKLFAWALSRNWKASTSAITTIAAYAYGKPREQIKFDGNVPISIQNWFLTVRNNIIDPNGGIPAIGSIQPAVVLPERVGDNGVGEANGDSRKHSGQTSDNGSGVRE